MLIKKVYSQNFNQMYLFIYVLIYLPRLDPDLQ